MGVFLIGSLVWMVAILLDKNSVFPKWFGYLSLCNALTEVVVAPAWIFQRGAFAWNGAIAWWINMVVFVLYTGVFIVLLRKMIEREDFGTGPLPTFRQGPAALASGAVDDERRRRTPPSGRTANSCRGSPTCGCSSCSKPLLFTGYFSVYLVSRTQIASVPPVPGRSGSARRRLQHHRPAAELVGDRAVCASGPRGQLPGRADATPS